MTLGTNSDATVTLVDSVEDLPARVVDGFNAGQVPEGVTRQLTLGTQRRAEATASWTYPIQLAGAATRGTDYRLECGDAAAVTCDLASTPPTLTLHGRRADSTSLPDALRLVVLSDTTEEPGEDLSISLGGYGEAYVYTRTLIDPPALVEVEFATASVAKTESNVGVNLVLTVTPPAARAITVPLTATDVTATAGTDYTVPATVTVPAGVSRHIFDVRVIDDTTYEGDETFVLKIDAARLPAGVAAGERVRLAVTIQDGASTITGMLEGVKAGTAVGEGTTLPLTLVMGRTLKPGETARFPITRGGDARLGADYTLACGTAAGVTCQGLDQRHPGAHRRCRRPRGPARVRGQVRAHAAHARGRGGRTGRRDHHPHAGRDGLVDRADGPPGRRHGAVRQGRVQRR